MSSKTLEQWKVSNGVYITGLESVRIDDNEIEITSVGTVCSIARQDFVDKWSDSPIPSDHMESFTGIVDEKAVIFGVHGPVDRASGPNQISAFDLSTGKMVWSSVADDGFVGGLSGPTGGSYSEIVDSKEYYILFGGHGFAMYINAFSKEDGHIAVRFSTSHLE